MHPLSNALYQVTWPPPSDNGAEIDLYWLEVDSEVRRSRRDADQPEEKEKDDADWRLVYKGAGEGVGRNTGKIHRSQGSEGVKGSGGGS